MDQYRTRQSLLSENDSSSAPEFESRNPGRTGLATVFLNPSVLAGNPCVSPIPVKMGGTKNHAPRGSAVVHLPLVGTVSINTLMPMDYLRLSSRLMYFEVKIERE